MRYQSPSRATIVTFLPGLKPSMMVPQGDILTLSFQRAVTVPATSRVCEEPASAKTTDCSSNGLICAGPAKTAPTPVISSTIAISDLLIISCLH
jgi:hypothetical protein